MSSGPVVERVSGQRSARDIRILTSVALFSVFSLIGPVLRLIFPPSADLSKFESVLTVVFLYIWPTMILATANEHGWRVFVILAAENLVVFAIFGLIVGICVRKTLALTVLYFITCAVIFVVDGWLLKSGHDFLSLCTLFATFLLYAIPFGALRRLLRPHA